MRLPCALAASARARPGHLALDCEGERVDYATLAARAAALAGGLASRGLGPGQRVALLGPPGLAWVEALHALRWLGASVAPLDPRASQAERAAALEALAPDALLALEGPVEGWPWLPLAPGPPLPARDEGDEAEALVILSSGSAGRPAARPLSAGQLLFSAMGSALRLGHLPGDRWLACLPLHHVGGLSILLRCALAGTTVELHPRFDAARVAARLASGEVQLVSLVPAMLAALIEAWPGGPAPAGLRAVLMGGAATPPELVARAGGLGLPLALTWGMSETASQVCTRFPGDLSPEPHCGPPLAFARVEAVDGRLVVEGPLAPGGRLVTADRGELDALGRVRVLGRADLVLVSGGENIDAQELEAALTAHPGVREAAVVARPDPRWGQRPIAAYVPEAEPLDEAELRAWMRARLSPFKCPDAFFAVDSLPRSALGKVARGALAEALGGRGFRPDGGA